MKRFSVLVMSLLVVGCVIDTNGNLKSIFTDECSHKPDPNASGATFQYGCKVIENYEDLTLFYKVEAMSLRNGKKVHYAKWDADFKHLNRIVLNFCNDLYGNCIISKDLFASTPDYKDLADYRRQLAKTQARNKAETIKLKENKEWRARQFKKREDVRVASNLDNYKKACKDYGFTSKRDIATCVQQEIRFDKQEAILTAQNQQLMAQNKEIEELRAEIMKVPDKSNKEFLLELLEPHRRMEEIKNQRQRDADIQAIKRALYR